MKCGIFSFLTILSCLVVLPASTFAAPGENSPSAPSVANSDTDHLAAAQQALADASAALARASTVDHGGLVEQGRRDLRGVTVTMAKAVAYFQQHPEDRSRPPVPSPDLQNLLNQIAILVPKDREQPAMFATLKAIKTMADELQLIPGGDWGGLRQDLINQTIVAGNRVMEGITYSRSEKGPGRASAASGTPTASTALTSEQMSGIVLIEAPGSTASGFITRVANTDVIVTNLHVLGETANLTVKNLQGAIVPWQGIAGAVGSDVALLKLVNPPENPPGLVLAKDVMQSAKIGDRVLVVGNRLGGGVATVTGGQIKGIGPVRVEVDAAFQRGNSGSPIVDLTNKTVIAVASYSQVVPASLLLSNTTAASPQGAGGNISTGEVRWFGYRLDTITKWENIDPRNWRAQMARVVAFRDTSVALVTLLQGKVSEARDNDGLRPLIDQFRAKLQRTPTNASGKGADPVDSLIRDFLHQLNVFAQANLKDFGNAEYYDYFRSSPAWAFNVPGQVKFRELLIKYLTDAEGNSQAFRSLLTR